MSDVARRSKRSNAIFALVLLTYALVAGGRHLLDRSEVFPFASFALYSHANATNTDYSVRIISVGDRVLDPPRYYQEAPELFPRAQDVTAQVAMELMGEALARGQTTRAANLQEVLEVFYLNLDRHQRVEYEVVKRKFDALDRWETGEFISEKPIATYEALLSDRRTGLDVEPELELESE